METGNGIYSVENTTASQGSDKPRPAFDFEALNEKCKGIDRALNGMDHVAIAYSGGVDSTFIVWYAHEKLGKRVSAFFADTVFISASEREDAFRTAERLGLQLHIISLDPLASASVKDNPTDRCYWCKKEIFGAIAARATELGCQAVVDGSHAGDALGYRPGKKALSELGIISPLASAGLIKEEIRQLSRQAGIPNWNKPSQSCLATRIPYGTPLSGPLLEKIEKAEDLLHGLGFVQVRVRCHGDLARIEIEPSDFETVFAPGIREGIVTRFGELGFAHIALDLDGFRSGCWDGTATGDAGQTDSGNKS